MKAFAVLLITGLIASLQVTQTEATININAVPPEMFKAITECLSKYGITLELVDKEPLYSETFSCYLGCGLQSSEMMSSNGVLTHEMFDPSQRELSIEIFKDCNSADILAQDAKKATCDVGKCVLEKGMKGLVAGLGKVIASSLAGSTAEVMGDELNKLQYKKGGQRFEIVKENNKHSLESSH